MKQAIIIISHEDCVDQTRNLLDTINTPYPVIIVTNTGTDSKYEMLGIETAIEYGIDEFFMLQSTIEIKNNDIFRIVFEDHKGKSVFMNYKGQMYLNKYRLDVIKQLELPKVSSKRDAVDVESSLHSQYRKIENPIVFDKEFKDNPKREEKFNRVNMVIENEYLKKYKGTWSKAMIGK